MAARGTHMFKTIVILLLLFILFALGSGMYYLISDRGNSDRAVKALTWRIGISLALFALLMIGAATGLITPHGLYG